MTWVRFWAAINCASGHSGEESRYEWFDRPLSEKDAEWLKDEAQEYVPSYMQDLERGYRYGFAILEVLPDLVRQNLIQRYEAERGHIDKMLAILEEREFSKPPTKKRTRFDRLR